MYIAGSNEFSVLLSEILFPWKLSIVFPLYCRPTYACVSRINIERFGMERQKYVFFSIVGRLKTFLNSYASSAILTEWYSFTWRERFYGGSAQYEISRKSVQWEPVNTLGQTDGRVDGHDVAIDALCDWRERA